MKSSKIKCVILTAGCASFLFATVIATIFLLVHLGVFLPDKFENNQLVLMARSAEKKYDGKELICDEWDIVKGDLMEGHHMTVDVFGRQLAVGQSSNRLHVCIFDRDGRDVTASYDLTVIPGTLTVFPIELLVVSESKTKNYDGMPLENSGTRLMSGNLMKGDTLTCIVTGKQTDVGSSSNTFLAIVTDENGNDVTSNYRIAYDYGELSVRPRVLCITTGNASKEYDGKPLTNDVWTLDSPDQLVQGQRVEVKMGMQLTARGSVENRPLKVTVYENGRDVSFCYVITFRLGTLTVK